MAQDEPKRQWKTGTDYELGKRDGVTDILTRAAIDKDYRARLLSKVPADVVEAFIEGGNFESVPYGFRVECFEREGTDDARPTDDAVMLVLPEASSQNVKLPDGGPQYWQCTYLPYKPTK
jgi:hypothetical protein